MISEKVKELFADTFDVDESDIHDETSRDSLANWDSLNHLRLVTALEQDFDISLTMDEINSMTSFSKIVEYVSHHLGS